MWWDESGDWEALEYGVQVVKVYPRRYYNRDNL